MKRRSIKNTLTKLMLLTLSWGNFQIFGLYFYIIFQVLYCIVAFYRYNKRIPDNSPIILKALLLMHVVTCISGMLSNLPDSYKTYNLLMFIVLIPSYIAFSFLVKDCQNNDFSILEISHWIKIGFLVQIIYLPIQFVLYKVIDLDFNKLFFTEFLHLKKNATFYRQGIWFPSAFTWHSAYLAPMLVFAVLLFRNNYIRIIILLDSYICGNNTALIGVVFAFFLMLFHRAFSLERRLKRRRFFELIVILVVMGVYLLGMGGVGQIIEKINYLLSRASITSTDTSSMAHISYYTLYPQVVSNQSIAVNIFGSGYGSSGYAISYINHQYEGLRHWVVESDIIDILVSRGIIGFITYYAFLLYIASKGKKLSYKYLSVVTIFILQGITYNVQFEYVFFLELILCSSILLKSSLFNESSNHFLS